MHAYVPTHSPFLTSVEHAPALPTVLAAMGHQCGGRCPADVRHLKAVWHVHRGQQTGSVGLIVVDVDARGKPIADLTQLISDVNECTGKDRIRVRLR